MMITSTSDFEKILSKVRLPLTLSLLIIITILSLTPTLPSAGPEDTDKALHLLAYGALTAPYAFSIKPPTLTISTLSTDVTRLRLLMFTGVWGAALEILQGYVGRSTDLWDIIANLAGTVLSLILAPWLYSTALRIFASKAQQ